MRFFDLHCDTAYECATQLIGNDLDKGAYHLSLGRGDCFDGWRQVFAIFMPDEIDGIPCRGDRAIRHYERVRDFIYRQTELFPDRFGFCRTPEDIASAGHSGFCGAIMSVEGGSALAGDITRLERLHSDGVKLMTLTWNAPNELGTGAVTDQTVGLTRFGKDVVARMNELGMIIDVSHLSDAGFFDVLSLSKKPFVASHSCSRRLCNHPRNLTNEMFEEICKAKGLVGINFCRGFLNIDRNASVTDVLRHTEHFLSLGGESAVCMGSDFDGTDMPDGITGVESMPDLYNEFRKIGYSDDLCDRIFWRNARDFFAANVL